MSHSRYALYLTPPLGSDVWRFGCDVLGRDASTGQDLEGFAPEGHSPESWRKLTAEPRRYGFHATFVAPFRLRADLEVDDLMESLTAFAWKSDPFEAGALQVGRLATASGGAFVALKPIEPARELRAFEEMAVRKLDALRAPLTVAERHKRDAARLTPLQRYYLDVWGYPYVLSEFRPHFTLTGALDDAEPVEKALRWDFQMRVASPGLRIEALTLFGERASDGQFEILREFPLGQGRSAKRAAGRSVAAAFVD
jgi:2'-5' RNA ligase